MVLIKQLKNAEKLLLENEFIKAHDLFEKLWREYKDDKKTRQESFILKAFVNASISFELHNMERIQHCENVWNTYKKYENLIDDYISPNRDMYKDIRKLIYKKRDELIR